MRPSSALVLLAGLAALTATPALAHVPGAEGSGFATGFAHPLGGWDHVLAMVAVGLWAAQLGGRSIWLAPLAFVASLVGGTALAMTGIGLPMVEVGILASIVAAGLLVAISAKLPPIASGVLIATFGILHGHAHGVEMPAAAAPMLYGLGFVLATVFLHGIGVALGVGARRIDRPVMTRVAGGVVAAIGLVAVFTG